MKINVKTLKGTQFEIELKPDDTVDDVKRAIETMQGVDLYPAAQQVLVYQGNVLNNGTTLGENNVAESSSLVVMVKKSKGSASAPPVKAPQSSAAATQPASAAPASAPTPAAPTPVQASAAASTDVYGEAASTLVGGTNIEGTVQQLLEMGSGSWDRDTVVRALGAAFNNPERAVEYLYAGIPEAPEVPLAPPVNVVAAGGAPPPSQTQPAGQQPPQVPLSGPNANPLDLFPQGLPNLGSTNAGGANPLEFLRNSAQFQALRAMVQANPMILQPMLQELGKQHPNLVTQIQEHQADFLRLINEPVEGGEGNNILEQFSGAVPQSITVTPEESEAIERLEAMGFDRALVLEVYFACNKNEELAANYLLDHSHEFQEE